MARSVSLHVYDLSGGLARTMSLALVGQQIDGIWHTGIVAYGREWFFGGGIFSDVPGQTPYGTPIRSEPLGTTDRTEAEFFAWLRSMASSKYHEQSYNLFSNNCNSFTDDAAIFLLNRHIPDEIRLLPSRFLDSPMGQAIAPLLSQQTAQLNDYAASHHGQVFAQGQNNNSGVVESQPAQRSLTEPVVFGGDPRGLTKIVDRVEADCAAAAQVRDNRRTMAQVHNLKTLLKDGTGSLHQSEVQLLQSVSRLLDHQSFAVIDLLRLSAGASAVTRSCLLNMQGQSFLNELAQRYPKLEPGVRLMVLRLFANLLAHDDGSGAAPMPTATDDFVVTCVCSELDWDRKPKGMLKAAAGLVFNFVLWHRRRPKSAGSSQPDYTPFVLASIECLSCVDKCKVVPSTALILARLMALLSESDDRVPQLISDLDLDVDQLAKIDPQFNSYLKKQN